MRAKVAERASASLYRVHGKRADVAVNVIRTERWCCGRPADKGDRQAAPLLRARRSRNPGGTVEDLGMRRVAIRSIIAGGLISVFASSFLGAISVVFVLLLLRLAHTPDDNVSGAELAIIHGNALYLGSQVVIGTACALAGGYITARLARHDVRLNGALSSVFSVGSGLVSIVLGHDPGQLVLQIVMLPINVVLGASGGYLYAVQVRAKVMAGP
jgi:hypothetical protein